MTETRYQRVAREIAERQAAREKRMADEQRKARKPRKTAKRWEDERTANHIDGFDRDDLGYSPDY